jgi:predicted MPP superfamily phosphohydrolase
LQNDSKTLIPIEIGQKKPYMLEVTRQDVRMRGLPTELHGATFAHLSDIHGGFGNTDPVYEEAIRQVNAVEPDLVLFTGDYIDDHAAVRNYPMQEVLSRFKAKRGVFGSFGNHDHRRGIVGSRRVLEQSGLHILNNESVCLEPGLWLAGVDDLYEGKPDIKRALADIPENVTAIVLSHNPRLIEKIQDRDILILSGHTHGGQIALPFPTPYMVCWLHLRCKQVAGWYENGRARLYVNRGLGVTGKPFRYNCPAEIGIFRLLPDLAGSIDSHTIGEGIHKGHEGTQRETDRETIHRFTQRFLVSL